MGFFDLLCSVCLLLAGWLLVFFFFCFVLEATTEMGTAAFEGKYFQIVEGFSFSRAVNIFYDFFSFK